MGDLCLTSIYCLLYAYSIAHYTMCPLVTEGTECWQRSMAGLAWHLAKACPVIRVCWEVVGRGDEGASICNFTELTGLQTRQGSVWPYYSRSDWPLMKTTVWVSQRFNSMLLSLLVCLSLCLSLISQSLFFPLSLSPSHLSFPFSFSLCPHSLIVSLTHLSSSPC